MRINFTLTLLMAELETFEHFSTRIEGNIAFSVLEVTSKAISANVITRQEQRKIKSKDTEYDQAAYFVEVLSQKIRNDATVLEEVIKMLGELGLRGIPELVKDIGKKSDKHHC